MMGYKCLMSRSPGHPSKTHSKSARPKSATSALAFAQSRLYQDAADAAGTLRAYHADLANYKQWCSKNKLTAMPPTPAIVGAYLAAAGPGYSLSTLRRRVAAIARTSRAEGYPLDTKHPAIRETLRGIARKHGSRQRRAAALTIEDIRNLCESCGTNLTGKRDRALLLLGFAGAFRRSELVGLDVEHITWTKGGMKILIARSKTDKEGAGAEIAIPNGTSDVTCPVSALRTWLAEGTIKSGPLFRKVSRGGVVGKNRLCTDAVRQILLKRAAQAGLKSKVFEPISPHSMRAGFVTTAYKNNVPDEEIMGHTRHRSLTTMRGYIRRAKLSGTSPAGKIGL